MLIANNVKVKLRGNDFVSIFRTPLRQLRNVGLNQFVFCLTKLGRFLQKHALIRLHITALLWTYSKYHNSISK